jgi:hypothetical protein
VASEAAPVVLQRVWTETDYRLLGICRVTQGGHMQHLRGIKKMECFSFHLQVARYSSFHHSSVPILLNVSGNFE